MSHRLAYRSQVARTAVFLQRFIDTTDTPPNDMEDLVPAMPVDREAPERLPEGTAVENTAAVLDEFAAIIETVPEVVNYQVYAGTSGPYNFNGLVRHYYLRQGPNVADIQVNFVHKEKRTQQSHDLAKKVRDMVLPVAQDLGVKSETVLEMEKRLGAYDMAFDGSAGDDADEEEAEEATDEDSDTPPPDDEDETEGEFIDESESEAAPKAV